MAKKKKYPDTIPPHGNEVDTVLSRIEEELQREGYVVVTGSAYLHYQDLYSASVMPPSDFAAQNEAAIKESLRKSLPPPKEPEGETKQSKDESKQG